MLQNDFYSEIVGSIEYHARQHGYHVIISATDVNESYLTLAKERNLDGIIVIGMYPDDFYRQMKKTQIPIGLTATVTIIITIAYELMMPMEVIWLPIM